MADQTTYLELSEDGGSSHKFYEVKVEGKKLSIRFGRIGDSGQLKVTDFPSADKALAEAQKKIAEKTKKGYAAAVMGERKKRAVTRREITSGTSAANQAPMLLEVRHRRPRLRHLRRRRALLGRQRERRHLLAQPRRQGARPVPPPRWRQVHRRRRPLALRRLR